MFSFLVNGDGDNAEITSKATMFVVCAPLRHVLEKLGSEIHGTVRSGDVAAYLVIHISIYL